MNGIVTGVEQSLLHEICGRADWIAIWIKDRGRYMPGPEPCQILDSWSPGISFHIR